MSEDSEAQPASVIRQPDVLESVMLQALGRTVGDDGKVEEIAKPLANYLFYGISNNF